MGIGETNGSLVAGNENGNEVMFGKFEWVKLEQATWWPAQVVDEKFISSANIPTTKGSSTDVLVRLYGSYVYMYVDLLGSRAEFKTILLAKNFSYHEIFKKSLEQDLPSCKSRKRQHSELKGKVTTDKSPVSRKKQKKEKAETDESHPQTPESKKSTADIELTTSNNITLKPPEFSARRVKVMQSLGLVAPSGSPFPRNHAILSNPTVLS